MNSTLLASSFFPTSSSTTEESSFNLVTSLSLTAVKTVGDVSPVTLSSEWSRMARLLLISCLSVVGSIGNVFMISSVMIEDHLKKAGKYFFFCFKMFLNFYSKQLCLEHVFKRIFIASIFNNSTLVLINFLLTLVVILPFE